MTALDERSAVSGIVHVGPHAVTHCREVSLTGADLLQAVDLAAYERYQATSSAPLLVSAEDHSLIPWSLAGFAANAAEWGADVIGMTAMPEARLAREAELPYALVGMVTDYDCWREEDAGVVATDAPSFSRSLRFMGKFMITQPAEGVGLSAKQQSTGPRVPTLRRG